MSFSTDLESCVILPKQRNHSPHQPHGFRVHSHNAADRNSIASEKKFALRLLETIAVLKRIPPSFLAKGKKHN